MTPNSFKTLQCVAPRSTRPNHRQDGGCVRPALWLILPENGLDAKFALRLDDAADVVAKEFAENLILHRRVGLAADVVPELGLDHGEGRFRVAAQVVMTHELVAAELEVAE